MTGHINYPNSHQSPKWRIEGNLFDDANVERTPDPAQTDLELAQAAFQGLQIDQPVTTDKPYPYGPPSDKPPITSFEAQLRRHQELGLPIDEGRGYTPPPATKK